MRIFKFLNDPRRRSVFAGAIGGYLGWRIAETLCGTPQSFLTTFFFGVLSGLGIGVALGAAEGLAIRSWSRAKRGVAIGLTAGVLGGAAGATFGQWGYAVTTGSDASDSARSRPSVFSGEMQARLDKAGAKSGEIEIGLFWKNKNDLDLHVIDPAGERIYFGNKMSRSGGELDVDRNAGCGGNLTNEPVEHVVWLTGTAPKGEYQIYVHHYANCGMSDPTSFRVELLNGTKRESFEGATSHDDPPQHIADFTRQHGVSPPRSVGSGLSSLGARILGWGIFGALLGCAEGFTRRSFKALRNAGFGGAIGGAIGGLIFQIIAWVFIPFGVSDAWCRFFGFTILGACIGLWIVIIERALSALLAVQNGIFEGRQVFLDKKAMRIGSNEGLEIFLGGDADITPHHATIRTQQDGHAIIQADGSLVVNDTPVSHIQLQHGDSILIGRTRLIYRKKTSSLIYKKE